VTHSIFESHRTTSLCTTCKQGIPAEIVEVDGRIVMRKECSLHGAQEVLVSSDAGWYHRAMTYPAALKKPAHAHKPVDAGCPYDCGACTSHEQSVYLPVIPITSACNLDCPICYTINKNEGAFHMSLAEFSEILAVIRRNDPNMKIINLTGGEPTRHPQLVEIVRLCHAAGIHRVTISTHGLSFIHDEEMLAELARLKARIVLSFDSFEEEVNRRMIGANVFKAKMRVLEQLAKFEVDTTLIPVLALGVNDHEVGKLIDLALGSDFIRSLEIHTMTFTGQGGTGFDSGTRLTVPDVLRRIEESTAGRIRIDDFVPSPCAHPLCYQTCYLLRTGEREFVPFTRFMTKENLRELLTDNLYIEPGAKMERVLEGVMGELWAMEIPDATAQSVLRTLKELIRELFPARGLAYADQQLLAERSAKTIYLHSHMDEGNFDTDRIRQCCVGVPSADGGNIPTCSYNILYRERDLRFAAAPKAPIASYAGGKKWYALHSR
jgi:7,8-dihydro-6-hydroxymethylpterin dimethyltransferase